MEPPQLLIQKLTNQNNFSSRKLVPWPGGKQLLAKEILDYIPQHKCYVEPFCGGATVFWLKEPSEIEVLNDINGELVNFYRVIQNHLEEFIRSGKFLLKSRDEFDRFQKISPETLTDIQRAVRFYYLLKNSFAAKQDNYGYSKQSRHGSAKFTLAYFEEFIYECHNRLRNVNIENLPWSDCITRYDSSETFFYIDPPYYGFETMYGTKWLDEDWNNLRELLDNISGKWLLSSGDCEEVREIFKGRKIKEVSTKYSMNRDGSRGKSRREILVFNF